MFNSYEVYHLMTLRKEEVARNVQSAHEEVAIPKNILFQKLVTKFRPKQKLTIVKTNCNTVCCC
jgi:hypothetical protein